MLNSEYQKLLAVYSETNLNRITTKLIIAYKKKNRPFLQKIASIVKQYSAIREDDTVRVFTSLIQLYHPDRLQMIKDNMATYIKNGELEKLEQFNHIFQTLEFLDGRGDLPAANDAVDYSFDIEYGFDDADFEELSMEKDVPDHDFQEEFEPALSDFIQVMSRQEGREFGVNTSVQSLEYLSGELNLSDCGIADLSGIEYCVNISSLNLSGNALIDIIQLGFLKSLEELFLSENQIDAIDSLTTLSNLKVLDLSFNQINDIRSILELPMLEFVNLIGNPIDTLQIEQLKNNHVLVLY
jgi:Leucine-rich repeat (LRR) protein